jgi:hypothetical protein
MILVLCWPEVGPAQAARLYRYYNDQGVLVIDHTVPADAAARGYEILSGDGAVLESVAPAAANTDTGGEAAATPRLSAEVVAEQEKIDRYLLTSYSSVADIEAVKARRLGEVEREIGIAEAQLAGLAEKREVIQERAANLQRLGKPVTEAILEELAGLDAQEARAQARLRERRLQHAELAQHYDTYAERFRELRERAEGQSRQPAVSGPAAATAPASAP